MRLLFFFFFSVKDRMQSIFLFYFFSALSVPVVLIVQINRVQILPPLKDFSSCTQAFLRDLESNATSPLGLASAVWALSEL